MIRPDLGSATVHQINETLGTQTKKEPLETFMGHDLWFDGYVAAADSVRIVGRWFASRKQERIGIVSVCLGTVQEISEGQPFDISGVWTQLDDGIELLKQIKDKALVDLKEFIRSKQVQ